LHFFLSGYKIANMNQINFSGRKKAVLPIVIVSLFILLSFFSCGGDGGGSGAGSISPSNSVTLAWNAPTTNTDGTPLTDLAGYKVYYGTSSGNYTRAIDVGNVETYKIEGLQSGTYYFATTAYDKSGNESDYSNEVMKTIK
jgi:hypothetical protein